MFDTILVRVRPGAQALQTTLAPVAPLLARLTTGLVFVSSGWGKLHHLDKVIGFFAELGIPAPQLQAPFVASLELVGGILLLLGLASRFAAVPLMGTMVVAILTAKRAEIAGLGDLFGTIEWTYLVLLGWIAIAGAGRLSLDTLVGRLAARKLVAQSA